MLELKSVSFGYNRELVIKNLDLLIKKGERVAIKGKSGSGKSTILRLIAGLEKVKTGSILLEDNDITNVPTFNRNVGFVFQGFALFPHLTVRKNILYGVSKYKRSERIKKLNEISKMLEIEDFLNRYPHEISGGQQQRVAIARSLITSPKILLLDEPFSALDQDLKENIRIELLNILKRLEITTILVTHDINDAYALCDRVVEV